jgi:hypothetical protein
MVVSPVLSLGPNAITGDEYFGVDLAAVEVTLAVWLDGGHN